MLEAAIGLTITVAYFLIGTIFDLYFNEEDEISAWVIIFWPLIFIGGIIYVIHDLLVKK